MASSVTQWIDSFCQAADGFKANRGRVVVEYAPDYPAFITVVYIAVIFYLPGYLKRRHIALKLKYSVTAWNLLLAALSLLGAYYTDVTTLDTLRARGFHRTCCEQLHFPDGSTFGLTLKEIAVARRAELTTGTYVTAAPATHSAANASAVADLPGSGNLYGRPAFFMALFMYLKMPEMLDTVFLILQGKPVSFLHWFHHLATSVYCWHASYSLIPSGVFFISMNYTVHAIMYFYYALVCLGIRRKIRWFAPVITLMQVTQMFVGMYITCYTYFQYWLSPAMRGTVFYTVFEGLFSSLSYARHQVMSLVHTGALRPHSEVPAYVMSQHYYGCDTDPTNLRMGVMMYGSYIVLFCVLFKELYLDKKVNARSLVKGRRTDDDGVESSAAPRSEAGRAAAAAKGSKDGARKGKKTENN